MNLSDYFRENRRAAIAFSGGVDSAYLLYEAVQEDADVTAYYVKSAFQPQFELDDAKRLAKQLNVNMKIIELDILKYEQITDNPKDRCYFCKRNIFSMIVQAANADGYSLLLDGTNASDDAGDRPGMRAIKELSVHSPLRECGLTKSQVRSLSKEAGLFTWNKPAYACLATRIPSGELITLEKLQATEKAEEYLFSLGFSDFRIRNAGNTAKIQLKENQVGMLLEKRVEILTGLKKYYDSVTLDLEVRQ